MVAQPDDDRLNDEAADAFGELVEQVIGRFEALGRRFSLPAFSAKALHMLSSPMAMKDLAQRFHCDPSFVTSIADMLDAHGLGRRETDTRDRRISNLGHPQGAGRRGRGWRRRWPRSCRWTSALDQSERECLLGLLRKMVQAGQECGANDPPPASKTSTASTASTASTDPPATSHPATGGNRAGEVKREPTPAAPSGG